MTDTTNTTDTRITESEVVTVTGDVWEWGDIPEAFRHIVDKKRLTKMIRNADTIQIWVPALSDAMVTPQKGALLATLKGLISDEFACQFNGLDLTIIGAVSWEEE